MYKRQVHVNTGRDRVTERYLGIHCHILQSSFVAVLVGCEGIVVTAWSGCLLYTSNFAPNPGFHEGCAWNYTFYVPHDVKGLAQMCIRDREYAYDDWCISVLAGALDDEANRDKYAEMCIRDRQ